MATYEEVFDPATGETTRYEVWEPNEQGGAETLPPEILQEPSSIPPHIQNPEPFRQVVADKYGVSPDAVMYGSAGTDRAMAGFQGDTDEEILNRYRNAYPNAKFELETDPVSKQKYPVGRMPDGSVYVPNKPGMDRGDVVEFSGREGLPMTMAAGGAALGGGGPASWLLGPAGYVAGKGIQEAGQWLTGTAEEAPLSSASRIGTEGLWELGGAALGKYGAEAWDVVRRGVFPRTPPDITRDVQAIEAGREQGMGLDMIRPYQLTDSGIIQGAARQREKALGGEAGAGQRTLEQRERLVEQDLPKLNVMPGEAADQAMGDVVSRRAESVYTGLPESPESFQSAGINMTSGFKTSYARSNREIQGAYRAADEAQALERPQFDLTQAQAVADSLGIEGLAKERETVRGLIQGLEGKPLTEAEVGKMVNVGPPEGRLRRAVALLQELDPVQTDYNVLKRLRSITGSLHKTFKFEGGDSYQGMLADKLYDSFTDTLRNPVNAKETPTYVAKFDEATGLARKQFEWLENTRIKDVLKKKGKYPVELFQGYVTNPSKLNPEMRGVIDQYAPKQANQLKQDILGATVNGKNAQQKLSELINTDPNLVNWLTGSDYQTGLLKKQVDQIAEFKASGYDEIYQSKVIDKDKRVSLLREQATSPKASRDFLRSSASAPEGKLAVQQTVGDALMEGVVVKDPKTGGASIDYRRYLKNKEAAEKAGWWDNILDDRQKTKLNAFEAYVRRTEGARGDMGSGLEVAATAGKLSQGDFLNLFFQQAGHQLFGGWLVSPKLGDKVYNSVLKNRKPGSLAVPVASTLGMSIAAMAHTAAGEGTKAVTAKRQPPSPTEETPPPQW